MKIRRIFSGTAWKGTRNYLNTQKIYEIIRTLLSFAISISLFAAGWITTGSRMNLLTVVAVLGCLPACRSAVGMIMFLRYHSLPASDLEQIDACSEGLDVLYDMVFTTYDKNYVVGHMVVRGNTLIGYTKDTAFDEKGFGKHMDQVLRTDGFKSVSVKIFTDIKKYTERCTQIKGLEDDESLSLGIMNTLKSVAL